MSNKTDRKIFQCLVRVAYGHEPFDDGDYVEAKATLDPDPEVLRKIGWEHAISSTAAKLASTIAPHMEGKETA